VPTEWERGFSAGWNGCMDRFGPHEEDITETEETFWREDARTMAKPRTKKKRKASAYSKRYGKAFKKLAPKYKKKNGSWKKDGFKRCGAAARKLAKR